jgi:hypothetical protein
MCYLVFLIFSIVTSIKGGGRVPPTNKKDKTKYAKCHVLAIILIYLGDLDRAKREHAGD